jgi:hypothetical protein
MLSLVRIHVTRFNRSFETSGRLQRWQRKFPIPSSAAFGRIGDEYVKAVYRFAEAHHIPVVHFKKGQNKEQTARPYLEAAARDGKDRVVLIGFKSPSADYGIHAIEEG